MKEPGCQKRRRKAIERRAHVADLKWRRENPMAAAFKDVGTAANIAAFNMKRALAKVHRGH